MVFGVPCGLCIACTVLKENETLSVYCHEISLLLA